MPEGLYGFEPFTISSLRLCRRSLMVILQAALPGTNRRTRPLALLTEQGERLLAYTHRYVEHWPETNRTFAGAQREQPEFEQTGVEFVALFVAGQIKREHQSSAPRRLDERVG